MAAGFGNAAFPLTPTYEVLTCIARILGATILVVDLSNEGDVAPHFPASIEGQWCGTPAEPVGFLAYVVRFSDDHFDALASLNPERDAGPAAKWKIRANVPGGALRADVEIDPSSNFAELRGMLSVALARDVAMMSYRGAMLNEEVVVSDFFGKSHSSQHVIEVWRLFPLAY